MITVDWINIIKEVVKLTSCIVAGAMGIRIGLFLFTLTLAAIGKDDSFFGNIQIKHFVFFGVFALLLAVGIYF